jgi:hypothetical protein
MKWYVKKEGDRWNIYLEQKYCKTKEPVLYCTSITEHGAMVALERLNNPTFVQIAEEKEFNSVKQKAGKKNESSRKKEKK